MLSDVILKRYEGWLEKYFMFLFLLVLEIPKRVSNIQGSLKKQNDFFQVNFFKFGGLIKGKINFEVLIIID